MADKAKNPSSKKAAPKKAQKAAVAAKTAKTPPPSKPAAAKTATAGKVAKAAAKVTASPAPVEGAAPSSPVKATRRGGRHVHTRSRGDRTTVDPSKIVKVPAAHALPGENEPLRYRPGRGPITQAEALGVLRRRERAKMKDRQGFVDESQVTAVFPAWGDAKPYATLRMSKPLKAFSEALAEIEEISWASYIELLIWEQTKLPPRSPEQVRAALRAMHRETVVAEMLEREYGP